VALGVEHDGGVAVITLDNGPLNLLTMADRAELVAVAGRLGGDRGTRAVVLAGAGAKAFCAGSDVTEFPRSAEAGRERARQEHACYAAVAALPQPVIAALHGHVLGGGVELALACDIRVADATARIGLPEVKLGLFPSGGGTQRLPRLIGASRAKELMFLGRTVDAGEAARLGVVDHVVEAGHAVEGARDLAAEIATRPALAVRAIKEAVDRGLADGVVAGTALEERLVGELFASHDAREGVAALLAQRPPLFEHC
jgi:enoyl-CoA hydratase/carnithine racemase